ncbi:MAG: GTPase Era [Bacteroidales bacterium]|nr:MAG: GTPase Era [Bacteroidales bacterium]
MNHKSGFVNILGNPNVGKSTLMNELVGEKLAIITSKAQTTRHRIMGIVNGDDFQIVYSDTPGILKPNYKLHESMMKSVSSATVDADLIIYVTDVIEKTDKIHAYLNKIKNKKIPVLLAINKVDLAEQETVNQLIIEWGKIIPGAEIIPISALLKYNIDKLFDRILELLPAGEPYYPKDALTDRPERFFVSEIIREKLIINYLQEIPYSVQVEIDTFKESERLINIRAIIYVLRNSQKGIIIGHKGEALKKVGKQARMDIEKFLAKKVYLELFVKVSKDWRNKERQLRNFGFR